MISSEFRLDARKKLDGKWGKAISILLAYFVTFFVFSFILGLFPESLEGILSIILYAIEIPLGFGFTFSLLKLFNDEDVKAFDFLKLGLNNFGRSWGVTFHTILKMLLPTILVIISYVLIFAGLFSTLGSAISSSANNFSVLSIIGIILLIVSLVWSITKSYYYQLAYLLVAENPEMLAKEAVEKSAELMKNKRAKLFCLQFSFIGWSILSIFTFGIGYLWLMPYIQFSTISFYKNALNTTEVNTDK